MWVLLAVCSSVRHHGGLTPCHSSLARPALPVTQLSHPTATDKQAHWPHGMPHKARPATTHTHGVANSNQTYRPEQQRSAPLPRPLLPWRLTGHLRKANQLSSRHWHSQCQRRALIFDCWTPVTDSTRLDSTRLYCTLACYAAIVCRSSTMRPLIL